MPAPLKPLGHNGPLVSPLGFGLAALSIAYGPIPPDDERFAILDKAVELGCTFWDTSDVYGDSELLLAKWFKRSGKRDEVFLATKFGLEFTGTGMKVDSSREGCRRSIERSLGRLGVESVDLYYAHRLSLDVPVEETVRAMLELQQEGKIGHIGLSGVSAATLRRACKVAKIAAVQMEYSPFVLDIEKRDDFLATCRELGVSVVAYSPIGRGMLSDSYLSKEIEIGAADARQRYARFNEENFETNAAAVRKFRDFAVKKRCTAPQLALAWLLKQGPDIVPIPGTKKMKYLEDNWGAVIVSLSDDEELEIRQFLENVNVVGSNMMPGAEAFFFQDTVEDSTSAS